MRESEKWDKYFLRIAREVATASKDPSSKVGALVVRDRRVLSTGYNGFPKSVADDKRLHDKAQKYDRIVHAEMNAVIYAGRESIGSTVYMFGFKGAPCINCAKHLIAAGIVRVVSSGQEIPDRWLESLLQAEELCYEAHVGLRYYEEAEL